MLTLYRLCYPSSMQSRKPTFTLRFLFLSVAAAAFLLATLNCILCARNNARESVFENKLHTRVPTESEASSQIIASLRSTNRNAVHVAIWTLKTNNIATPPDLNFELQYRNAASQLNTLADRLEQDDNTNLNKLDASLAYHWEIYSPIWSTESETWD